MNARRMVSLFFILPLLLTSARGADWPQWWGPERDGISLEKGLMQQWPTQGLKLLWQAPMGLGYSSVSVADGRIFTMFQNNEGQWIVCLDEKSGKENWKVRTGDIYMVMDYHGPRSTPTVDGNRVYCLDALGNLLCLDVASHKKVWGFNILDKFGAKNLKWGVSTSPLVDGNNLIVDVGGPGAGIVALNKKNGEIVWKALSDQAGYSSPIIKNLDGQRQIVALMQSGMLALLPTGGDALWRIPWKTSYDVHAATPIVEGNKVFITSGYNVGSGVYQINLKGEPKVKEVWRSTVIRCKQGNPILYKGYIYGFDESGAFKCMDFANGKEMWKQPGLGNGSLVIADDMIYLLSEQGDLMLVKPNSAKFDKVSDAGKLLGKRSWSMPVVANGKLFIRDEEKLLCLDVKGK